MHGNDSDTFEGVDIPLDLQDKLDIPLGRAESHNLMPIIHENSSFHKNKTYNNKNKNMDNAVDPHPSHILNFISLPVDVNINTLISKHIQQEKPNHYFSKTMSSEQLSLLSTYSLILLLERQRISQLNHPMH